MRRTRRSVMTVKARRLDEGDKECVQNFGGKTS
jgi:hypothetical protein